MDVVGEQEPIRWKFPRERCADIRVPLLPSHQSEKEGTCHWATFFFTRVIGSAQTLKFKYLCRNVMPSARARHVSWPRPPQTASTMMGKIHRGQRADLGVLRAIPTVTDQVKTQSRSLHRYLQIRRRPNQTEDVHRVSSSSAKAHLNEVRPWNRTRPSPSPRPFFLQRSLQNYGYHFRSWDKIDCRSNFPRKMLPTWT